MNGLKLGTGVANGATKATETESREGATSRPHAEGTIEKPPETAEEVETRLDRTQPVAGDSNVASESPEGTFLDPPTPAEERKNTLESKDGARAPASEVDQPSADDGVVRYSSHPILNYGIGRFKFDNGLLELSKDKDVAEFEKVLAELPLSERNRIKKLDLSAAEAQSRAVRAAGPKASKAIGSDSGDREPANKVGRGTLGDPHGE